MYKVKNLTNSPYRITTADGGFGIVLARGEGEFDIHPLMLNSYKQLGYMEITEVGAKPEEVEKTSEPDGDDEKTKLIADLAELGVEVDGRTSVKKLRAMLEEKLAEASE